MLQAPQLADHVIAAARIDGVRLSKALPMRWLTARGHLEPMLQGVVADEMIDVLDRLHSLLGGNRRALARKAGTAPQPALIADESGQLVALDGVEHFTAPRSATLDAYPKRARLGFSLDDYRSLIDTWRERAHSVFTPRTGADFDFAGGRRAQRAYYDAVADLLAPTFTGSSVLRIPVLDGSARRAARSIVLRLG
jgi:hypothetical protein